MADEYDKALLSAIAALHTSDEFSDMVISCGGHDFRVHQAVVCSQSKLLAREVQSDFKESSGLLEHNHFGPDAIRRMIQFLYTRSYDVPSVKAPAKPADSAPVDSQNPSKDADAAEGNASVAAPNEPERHDEGSGSLTVNEVLTLHVEMSAAGSYFDIDNLKLKAAAEFKRTLDAHPWEKQGFPALLDRIYAVPESEDRGVRDAVLKVAQKNALALSQEPDFVAILDDSLYLGEFCAAFVQAILKDHSQEILRHERAKTKLSAENSVLRQIRLQEQAAKAAAKKDLETVTEILEELETCRNPSCATPIAIRLGRRGRNGGGDMVVRCKKCNTKHYEWY